MKEMIKNGVIILVGKIYNYNEGKKNIVEV